MVPVHFFPEINFKESGKKNVKSLEFLSRKFLTLKQYEYPYLEKNYNRGVIVVAKLAISEEREM